MRDAAVASADASPDVDDAMTHAVPNVDGASDEALDDFSQRHGHSSNPELASRLQACNLHKDLHVVDVIVLRALVVQDLLGASRDGLADHDGWRC